MTTFGSVAVIGLGLIGGSVARDLSAIGTRVVAFDTDERRLAAAVRTKVVSGPLDASLDGLRDVDVVVIATPVDVAAELLRRVGASATRARLITDVGSTKGSIVEAARTMGLAERFVGSHPLAGDHRSGWEASRTGLFVDAPVYLCANSESSATSVELAETFWRRLGARPERMAADAHDRRLAWTSHLPHMISSALALALARSGIDRADLGPGGRDVTRLAGSSPDLWTAIALDNAAALEEALRRTELEIATLRASIHRADQSDLRARLCVAQAWFDQPEPSSANGGRVKT